ncbi:FtsX-like permease family protein [Amnibacterium kyonggiense]
MGHRPAPGAPRLPWLTGIFLEPAIALLLGGAAGAVAGAVLAEVVVATALHPVVPLELGQPAVLVAAGLTLLGSVVALVAASLRSARTPLPALLRETAEPRRLSRAGVAAQSGLVIVTLLAAYTAATNSRISGPQVALLVPGLLAALFGLAAVRAAVGGARLVSARPPRSLAGVLVGRRLARAPSELYTVIVIVVGVALAGYCMQLALVAVRLEDARAAATVGSATVLRVTVPRDLPLQRAVERADPSGRSALAAEELSPASASGTGRVVALDTTRLRAVTGDDGVDLPPSLLAALRPRVGPSMVLRGTSLRIVLDDARITSFGDQTALVGLSMVVQDDAGWHTVSLGPVRSGAIEAPIPCPSGCRVVWIGTHGLMKAATPYQADMTITSISTDQQSAAALAPWLDPTRWRNRIGEQTNPERPARATVAAANGLFVDFADDQGSDFTTISTFDAPEPLPVIVGSDTGPQPYPGLASTALGTGLDELPRVLHVVGAVDVLPRLLHVGALADLEMMNRVDDPGASKAVDEVWLAPGPHPAVLASLRRQGVTVQHVEHADSVAGTYRREPVPLAAALTGAIALTVVLLAVLTLVATRVIDADARRREWRSALAAGVDERRLRRLLTLSVLVPNAVGVLLGAAAGTIAFLLTASRLPLLTGAGPVPAPDFAPPLLPVAAAALGVVVLIAAVAMLSARREVRRLDGR